jgi:hypothetical protein
MIIARMTMIFQNLKAIPITFPPLCTIFKTARSIITPEKKNVYAKIAVES